MKRGISIQDFLKTKEITPEDLKDNFKFVRRIDVNMVHHEGCPNCDDKSNFYSYPSPSWTQVNQCIACGVIMITYISDRMGGAISDTVDVYEQINKPMNKRYYKCDIGKSVIECLHCGNVSDSKHNYDNLFCDKCNVSIK